MKLVALYLDDVVVVPKGKSTGEGEPRQDLRATSFHADDGWQIEELPGDRFRLQCKGMPDPVTVGGYGYTFIEERATVPSLPAPAPLEAGTGPRRGRKP